MCMYVINTLNNKYIQIGKKSGKRLFNLNEFDLDKYILVKGTSNYIFISKEELINFKYSIIMLFSKQYYKKEDLELWFKFLIEYKIDCKFLNKPLPPTNVINLIKIINNK